ncbi:MAG: 3-isopropylmalate dehydratase [Clostridia bacterium]|jgi:3-isopropylmalate/(R)-2-methylmalate dehydratase small subunit|nr:3-isopropylmalate dehydratase [Clostridiales bacterium]
MEIKDKVIKYGNDINTDLIIAGKYTKTLSNEELAVHAMEDLDVHFTKKVKGASIVVAGSYFGCGSSREAAPVALRAAGVSCVFAKSFARIFFRNAVNVGLPIVECDTDRINDGDTLRYVLGSSEVINETTGESIPVNPLPEIMVKIFQTGGLVQYFRETGGY